MCGHTVGRAIPQKHLNIVPYQMQPWHRATLHAWGCTVYSWILVVMEPTCIYVQSGIICTCTGVDLIYGYSRVSPYVQRSNNERYVFFRTSVCCSNKFLQTLKLVFSINKCLAYERTAILDGTYQQD